MGRNSVCSGNCDHGDLIMALIVGTFFGRPAVPEATPYRPVQRFYARDQGLAGYSQGYQDGYDQGLVDGTVDGTVRVVSYPASRIDPIVARLEIVGTDKLWVYYKSGTNTFTIYDSTESEESRFLSLFRLRSSLVADGDDYVFTTIPNGGWWNHDFKLIFVTGVELTEI